MNIFGFGFTDQSAISMRDAFNCSAYGMATQTKIHWRAPSKSIKLCSSAFVSHEDAVKTGRILYPVFWLMAMSKHEQYVSQRFLSCRKRNFAFKYNNTTRTLLIMMMEFKRTIIFCESAGFHGGRGLKNLRNQLKVKYSGVYFRAICIHYKFFAKKKVCQ